MLREFKEFALKGNMVDMAIGIVVGAAFGAVIASLVADVIMPPLGLLLGETDFARMFAVLKEGDPMGPYATADAAASAGAVTLNYGLFIVAIIDFLLVALALFFVVRTMNRLRRKEAPAEVTTKACPFCKMEIALQATRCPHCTSELSAA
jgi:large conductance mechanosensitive channel